MKYIAEDESENRNKRAINDRFGFPVKFPSANIYVMIYSVIHRPRVNETQDVSNETLHTTTVAKATTRAPPTPAKPILPEQTGVEAQEEEQSSGMTIFFSLLVIGICIILVHLLIKYKLNFLPESVAVVSLGICIILVHLLIKYKLNFLPESVAVVSLDPYRSAFPLSKRISAPVPINANAKAKRLDEISKGVYLHFLAVVYSWMLETIVSVT
ncbi:UNVERIFIED_CONTAM: hypothetical protein FKN15_025427 [Acipenser sinensis]